MGGVQGIENRRHQRVLGPFDGRWVDLLTTDLRIYDLSVGGCLIESHVPLSPGRRFTLEIQLPVEGWVSMKAEAVHVREGFGYAVRFVEMSDEVRLRLNLTVASLAPKTNDV